MMSAVMPLAILPNGVAAGDLVIKRNGSYEFDIEAMNLRGFVEKKYIQKRIENAAH